MIYLYPQLVLHVRTTLNEHYDLLIDSLVHIKDDEANKFKTLVRLETRRNMENALLDDVQKLLLRLWPTISPLFKLPQDRRR